MALKRALRLRKSSDFQRVRQQGHSVTSRLLILAWVPNNENATQPSRIGFVVSKRISKLAVTRNYIKRLLSEAIRPVLPEILGGLDIVIGARGRALNVDVRTFEQDMRFLLRRARLLEALPRPDSLLTEEGTEGQRQ